MKGKILDYNIQKSSGVISGDDENRYSFSTEEWKNNKSSEVGQVVDFEIDGKEAKDIYLEIESSTISEKNKMAAGLLALFLGAFGIHKFYLGCNKAGGIMLGVWLVGLFLAGIPSLIIAVIAFIEAIIYFTKSNEEFNKIYIKNEKCWF